MRQNVDAHDRSSVLEGAFQRLSMDDAREALELVMRPNRTKALPAEISAAESTVNAATLPSWLLIQSIQNENLRSADKGVSRPDDKSVLPCGQSAQSLRC